MTGSIAAIKHFHNNGLTLFQVVASSLLCSLSPIRNVHQTGNAVYLAAWL